MSRRDRRPDPAPRAAAVAPVAVPSVAPGPRPTEPPPPPVEAPPTEPLAAPPASAPTPEPPPVEAPPPSASAPQPEATPAAAEPVPAGLLRAVDRGPGSLVLGGRIHPPGARVLVRAADLADLPDTLAPV